MADSASSLKTGLSAPEMDDMFETLYNNIGSNQAPGLNAYEKSIFLTKAQDEIVKNYFNSKSKGNNVQEGFDGNPKRQVDFSMITRVETYSAINTIIGGNTGTINPGGNTTTPGTGELGEGNEASKQNAQSNLSTLNPFGNPLFDPRSNTKSIILPDRMMMAINEMATVTRDANDKDNKKEGVLLQVIPIKFDEYSRLMSKPYKRPLKYQAWRLINNHESNKADIIIGPTDTLTKYVIRYIVRPTPIIVSDLDELTIEGLSTKTDCTLDGILHEEIVQRAVELAKAAWTSTGQDNIQVMMQAGQRSE